MRGNLGRTYYYAAGDRIQLTPETDTVALDERRAKSAGLAGSLRTASRGRARTVASGIILLTRDSLSQEFQAELQASGAVLPLFRVDDTLIVVLPEVRVEDPSPARIAAAKRWLAAHRDSAVIVSEDGERLTVRPKSGRGDDALELANALVEDAGVESAHPRFLRIVRRPGSND